MKNKILNLTMAASLLFSFLGIANLHLTYALDCSSNNLTAQEAVQCGTNGASGNNQDSDQAPKRINKTIIDVINILSTIVGIIAVIMIVVAGFRYITSAGDTNKITSARNTLLYAVIGLVIVALAQVIVRFVLDKATAPVSQTSSNTSSSSGNSSSSRSIPQ
jgi:ABC-type Fe3+ transport system permease subunit